MMQREDAMERSEGMEGMERDEAVRAAGDEITAAELGADIAQAAREANEDMHAQEGEMLEARVREGIGELFEDGWSAQELAAFSCDAAAQEAIAAGKSVARAACAYLRARTAQARKGSVPTAQRIATGGYTQDNAIDRMTDEEFAAFSRRAQAAMREGRKVRI